MTTRRGFTLIQPTKPTTSGRSAADGGFRLSSRTAGDGTPAGEDRVTVTWPEPPRDGDDSVPLRDWLGGNMRTRRRCRCGRRCRLRVV